MTSGAMPTRSRVTVRVLWMVALLAWVVLWVRSPFTGLARAFTGWSLPVAILFLACQWWTLAWALRNRSGAGLRTRAGRIPTVTLATALVWAALFALAASGVAGRMRLDGYYLRRSLLELSGRSLEWSLALFPVLVCVGVLLWWGAPPVGPRE